MTPISRWIPVLLIVILLTSAGCNLSSDIIDNPTPSPTQPSPIVEHPTNQPPTATPLPPTPTTIKPTNVPVCTPRADWPIYIVATGDTLGRIAVRTGTSAAALTQANCLTNANLISVGQALRVPRQPTPPTAVPPSVIPTAVTQQLGSISVTPYITADAGNFAINGGTTVTISWSGGPADVVRTDFFQRTFNGTITLISSDTNASDGLSTTWLAPVNFQGTLTASATRSDGSTITPIFTPTVYVNDPSSANNAIALSTYLRFESQTYFVQANIAVGLLWLAAPISAARVDFTFSPADRTAQPYLLGSDTNMADGATANMTLAPGDLGIVSAEAFRSDGTRITFASAITVNGSVESGG